MRAPLEPKPLPRKKPTSGGSHGEAILIGILLPVLVAAAWFGYAVYDRTLHPRELTAKDEAPSLIDDVAGFFGGKAVAVAEPVPGATAGTGPAIEPPIKPTGPAIAVTPTVKEELPALAPAPTPSIPSRAATRSAARPCWPIPRPASTTANGRAITTGSATACTPRSPPPRRPTGPAASMTSGKATTSRSA